MRPVSTDSAHPKSLSCSYPLVGSLPATEMSLLQSLGPVQNWLGQELEKCGIDAMIYTRYVLSLLLHDSYDYDLQDQVRSYKLNISDILTESSCSCFNSVVKSSAQEQPYKKATVLEKVSESSVRPFYLLI